MSTVKVKLSTSYYRHHRFTGSNSEFVKTFENTYTVQSIFQLDKTGEDAAEEVFEITNNPARQAEREEKYGNGRSLSVGDIVEVDGVDYFCDSVGWEIV